MFRLASDTPSRVRVCYCKVDTLMCERDCLCGACYERICLSCWRLSFRSLGRCALVSNVWGGINAKKVHTERHRGLSVEFTPKKCNFPGTVLASSMRGAHTVPQAGEIYCSHGEVDRLDGANGTHYLYHVLLNMCTRQRDALRRVPSQVFSDTEWVPEAYKRGQRMLQ